MFAFLSESQFLGSGWFTGMFHYSQFSRPLINGSAAGGFLHISDITTNTTQNKHIADKAATISIWFGLEGSSCRSCSSWGFRGERRLAYSASSRPAHNTYITVVFKSRYASCFKMTSCMFPHSYFTSCGSSHSGPSSVWRGPIRYLVRTVALPNGRAARSFCTFL